jgi:hypothetical protein
MAMKSPRQEAWRGAIEICAIAIDNKRKSLRIVGIKQFEHAGEHRSMHADVGIIMADRMSVASG